MCMKRVHPFLRTLGMADIGLSLASCPSISEAAVRINLLHPREIATIDSVPHFLEQAAQTRSQVRPTAPIYYSTVEIDSTVSTYT